MNGWGGLLILVIVILAALAVITNLANPDPGDKCVYGQEGVVKFHSTGKVVVCEGGTWVLKNGNAP